MSYVSIYIVNGLSCNSAHLKSECDFTPKLGGRHHPRILSIACLQASKVPCSLGAVHCNLGLACDGQNVFPVFRSTSPSMALAEARSGKEPLNIRNTYLTATPLKAQGRSGLAAPDLTSKLEARIVLQARVYCRGSTNKVDPYATCSPWRVWKAAGHRKNLEVRACARVCGCVFVSVCVCETLSPRVMSDAFEQYL